MGLFKKAWKGLGKVGKKSYNAGRGILGLNQVKDSKELIKAQEQSQRELDAEARQANYEYGEMAADSAHDRSLALLQATTEANSLESKVADAKAAGLSPGLVLGGGAGGGGSAGGGAMGTGTRGPGGEAPNYLDIASVKEQRRANQIEAGRVAGEQILAKAEAAKIKAETENIKEQTESNKALSPLQEALLGEQAASLWIDNNRKVFENEGSAPSSTSPFGQKVALEIAEATARVEGIKIENELNTEKKKVLWQELLNEIRKTDILQTEAETNRKEHESKKYQRDWDTYNEGVKARAVKLASEWSTGEFTNWKTWVDLGEKGVRSIIDAAMKK